MLRFLGGIMILGGCLGMGLWYRGRFVGRLRTLRLLQRIQELLISEIRYGRATLPECCLQIAGRLPEPYRQYLIHIYDKMQENTGVIFGQVFSEYMGACLEELPVTGEDRKIFLTVFTEQGFQDEGMQIRSIEQSKELLEHTIEKLEAENNEKCRMAVGLGAMSGLLIVIVLL